MVDDHAFAISFIERTGRVLFGMVLFLCAFRAPINAEWFARLIIASTYPLFTALTNWDPFYRSVNIIRDRIEAYHFYHS